GAYPSSKVLSLTYQNHSSRERPGLGIMKHTKLETQESLRHNRVSLVRGGALAESSQSSEPSIGMRCNTCGRTVHSTTDHNAFDHFKKGSPSGTWTVDAQGV
nr:hypothetical protein [Tanacetum cinerariifolium]